MITFNRVLATLIALALIVGAAIGIVFLIGLIVGAPALTALVAGWFQTIAGLGTGEVQAILLGIFILSLVLLVLEVRPWRSPFIYVRDDSAGRTQVFRSDIERYLAQRLSGERAITPQSLDVVVRGNRFDVETGVAVPTDADREAVRSRVERNIIDNLRSIGLEEDLERLNIAVSRSKRVA